MAMPNTAPHYTVQQVMAFPDEGNRYELVHGELLVTPAPSEKHQDVVLRIALRLGAYLRPFRAAARMFIAPGDVIWSDAEYVQPDLFVVSAAEVTGAWKDIHTLLLAVEVVSPSSARADRLKKRQLYQERAVGTYWAVDLDAQLVEVWQPGDERPEIVTERLEWRVAPHAPPLRIPLAELFADLPG